MINSLQLLRNIGQFDSVTSTLPFAKNTLIYAENGRGKTTLAAVLRSLATGDPVSIAERRRLSATHPPHVVCDCSGGPQPARFENEAWTRILPNMVVFDDQFIDQNVYSGLAVEAGHRQKLHQLIVGAQGVLLNERLQALVARIETHNSTLRNRAAAIPATERGALSADEFCSLPTQPDIDVAIQEAERRLLAARQQNPIRTNHPFDPISLPAFDIGLINRSLEQDLSSLDAAAAARVQAHLAGLGRAGETWIAEGMRLRPQINSSTDIPCPFCAQNLQGSVVITHYRAYFSAEYSSLKRGVSELLAAVNRIHSGAAPAAFERAVRILVERRQFWSTFCDVPAVGLDTAAIVDAWRAAHEAIAAALTAKQAAPLEKMPLGQESRAAVEAYNMRRGAFATLNQQLQEANARIRIVKEQAATSDLVVLGNDLARLETFRARQTPATSALCAEYILERNAKAQTEQQRDQVRAQLEQHRVSVFPAYELAINAYLQRFNAGFRLGSVASADTRGGPTCNYSVIINNTPVAIAGGDPHPGSPSFRNTLSAGDRNTLALAFFFASVDQDPNQADKVVVIDDPSSSLDEHRTLATVQEIRRLADRVAQVIVLSHNKPFLCKIWEGADQDACAAIEVARDEVGSTLRAWNVSQDSITEHDRRFTLLNSYVAASTTNNREVAQAIRPFLEGFCRVAYPGYFPPGTMLGVFRGLCEQRLASPHQILNRADTTLLCDIIEYANRYHHSNPSWQTEAINDAELLDFVGRVLRFTSRPL